MLGQFARRGKRPKLPGRHPRVPHLDRRPPTERRRRPWRAVRQATILARPRPRPRPREAAGNQSWSYGPGIIDDPDRGPSGHPVARGEDRPDDPGLRRPGGDRARGAARLPGGDPGRPGRRRLQPLGSGAHARGPAARRRGDAARDSAAAHVRSDPRPPDGFSDSAGRSGRLRSGTVAADRARRRPEGPPTAWPRPSRRCSSGRDPRWGRIAESPGEDPWLAARFADAKTAASRAKTSPREQTSPRPPSISPPMARSPRAASTPRSTSRERPCTRPTCRRSGPRSKPASPRSCRPSSISRACR